MRSARGCEGEGPPPPALASVPGLAENLKLQDGVAQRLKARRHDHGALELETTEMRAEFEGDTVAGLAAEKPNRAKDLIEDFMIAANGIIARFLEAHTDFPSCAASCARPSAGSGSSRSRAELGEQLPGEPDAPALNAFLLKRRAADPLRFPDLSLTIIKLLGRGEYVASFPGQAVVGHFGLAVSEYTHSTAPNRRYPDLVTQRLVRAALAGEQVPYGTDELGRARRGMHPQGGRRAEGRADGAQGRGRVSPDEPDRPGSSTAS